MKIQRKVCAVHRKNVFMPNHHIFLDSQRKFHALQRKKNIFILTAKVKTFITSLADFERIHLRIKRHSNYKKHTQSSYSCSKCVKPVQKAVSYDAIQNKRNIISKYCKRMIQTVYKKNKALTCYANSYESMYVS